MLRVVGVIVFAIALVIIIFVEFIGVARLHEVVRLLLEVCVFINPITIAFLQKVEV